MSATEPIRIIHHIRDGGPPCGMPGKPSDWPSNHAASINWPEVTCRLCIAKGAPSPPEVKSATDILGSLPKLKLISAEESERRKVEHDQELREQAAMRMRDLIAGAGVPKRQSQQKELVKDGPWGEKLLRIGEKLGTGFIVALIGIRGNGKTQLAVELIRECARRGKPSLYATATEFFMDIKATYKQHAKESEREVIRRYGKRDLLVLDEIGKRGETDWEDRLLFELIDRRYRDTKDTLLVSNQEAEKFSEAVGAAITSRLKETGGIVECDWESFR